MLAILKTVTVPFWLSMCGWELRDPAIVCRDALSRVDPCADLGRVSNNAFHRHERAFFLRLARF
jgi:hypothetical protein